VCVIPLINLKSLVLFRMLFWTDWDSEAPRIESSSMSGDGRKVVIRVGDMSWPNGLTLDLVNKRVFYCDAR